MYAALEVVASSCFSPLTAEISVGLPPAVSRRAMTDEHLPQSDHWRGRLQALVRRRVCLRNVALYLQGFGQTLCHKLKNGRLNYASWRSLLPDNLLQTFNRFWGKQPFARFPAHARRDMLNDEHLP